jgi:hypothetical protein
MREQRNAEDAMEAAVFKNSGTPPALGGSDDKSKEGAVSIERIRFLSFADMKFVKATERVGELATTWKNVVAKAEK